MLFRVWLGVCLFLVACAIVGLFVSLYGLLTASNSLSAVAAILAQVARLAGAAARGVQDIATGMTEAVPDLVLFARNLVANNVVRGSGMLANASFVQQLNVSSLNATSVDAALEHATAIVTDVLGAVAGVVTTVREVACLFPVVSLATDLALIATMIIGQGVCVAGCLLCGAALIRSKRGLLAAGMALVFLGCAISLLSFALSAPLSVWVDDACFTVNTVLHSAARQRLERTVLLACARVDDYRAAMQGFLNTTRFFFANVLVPQLQNVSLVIPDMPGSVLDEGSNSEIVQRFLNVSLPPVLAFLHGLNLTNLTVAAADAIRGSGVVMEGVQVVSEALERLGDCESPLSRKWLERADAFMCTDLSQGLIMAVWGTFTAAVALLLLVVLVVVGSPLMSNSHTSLRAATCMVLAVTGSISSLVVALVALYGRNADDAIVGLFFATFAVLLLAFLDLSVPLRFWKTEGWVRFCWALAAGLGLVVVVLSAVLLGLVVPQLTSCWARDEDTCTFGCATARVTAVTVATAIAVFTCIAGLVLLGFGLYFVIVVPPVKNEFSEMIDFDYDMHAVYVATMKPVPTETQTGSSKTAKA